MTQLLYSFVYKNVVLVVGANLPAEWEGQKLPVPNKPVRRSCQYTCVIKSYLERLGEMWL